MSAFLQELRSRSIYKIAAGYIVSAWLLLQIASTLANALGLPAWTLKVVFALLMIGFGGTLAIGWRRDQRQAQAAKPSVKVHLVIWPAVVLFVVGGLALIFSVITEIGQSGDARREQLAEKSTASSAPGALVKSVIDLQDGIQIKVGEEQKLLADKDLGLRDIAGKGIVIWEYRKGRLQFLTGAGKDTYLIDGTDFLHLKTALQVLAPGKRGEFDNSEASIGAVIRSTNRVYGFYEGSDKEGDLPTSPQGVKGMYLSIGLVESGSDGTWTKKGQIITSNKPKEWADWAGQSIRGAGAPSAVVDPSGQYVYLYYTAYSGLPAGQAQICLARSLINGGIYPGGWEKFYLGKFGEPGLGGNETPVVDSYSERAASMNAHVTFSPKLKKYILTLNLSRESEVRENLPPEKSGIYVDLSDDGIAWSNPVKIISAYSRRLLGLPISVEPTLVMDSPDSLTGWLLYSTTPKYSLSDYQGTPLYLVGRRIEFSQSSPRSAADAQVQAKGS
ncbi:MAG: hypothetical protein JO308_10700 [Verrucomicrobia bacterium]|nr:hypothetical protein [Verrucomicrobiota bacterium]